MTPSLARSTQHTAAHHISERRTIRSLAAALVLSRVKSVAHRRKGDYTPLLCTGHPLNPRVAPPILGVSLNAEDSLWSISCMA